jgi:hypothetical protein
MKTNGLRRLPVFTIEGTDFYVDIRSNEFREVDIPSNCISMNEMADLNESGVSGLVYDKETRNVYAGMIDPDNIPANVAFIIVPPLEVLDPIGLARKNGLADNAYARLLPVPPKRDQPAKKITKQKRGRRL